MALKSICESDFPNQSGDSSGAVSSPDLSSGGKARKRAIRDVAQAKSIITTLETANRERNQKNARIMAKYNAERPYTQQSLESEGLGWKSNFSTQPLVLLIDKVAPRFTQALGGVKYLTNSALPDSEPGAAEKTDNFRREITDTIRARPGWKNFLAELAMENALFGYAAVGWLDEFHWFPKFFRQDAFFIPTGTKQSPSAAQVVVLKETLLLHELAALIHDREAAKTRGWNVTATTKAINSAMPENRRTAQTDPERIYEDMIRESVVGTSHESGARVVTLWHLLASEIDGKVSHYIFDGEDFSELFSSEDQYSNMPEAVAFFSFQQGNSTMHGSKGIGRQLYSLAGILDRSRNEVVDRLNLAGKILVQGDEKQLRKFKMGVVGNTILIGSAFNVIERKFDAGVEPFLSLDAFLTGILDQMAGATTPRAFEGERVTKAAVDLFAAREEESRDTIVGRFLLQAADLITVMQRRLCDPDTAEKDAKEMQKRLLKVMTREEIKELSKQAVAEVVADYTDLERQQVVLAAQEGMGDPLLNQKELRRRKLTAQVNADFAEAVLLPDEDPTETAEQTRLQQLELLLIAGQGAEVPISPRDNHLVHLAVLMPVMESTAQSAAQDPAALAALNAELAHGEQHLAAAEAAGAPKEALKAFGDVLKKLRGSINELHQLAEQEKATAQEAGVAMGEAGAAPVT